MVTSNAEHEHVGSVGLRHLTLESLQRSHPGELYRSNRIEAPIDRKGRPLAQMRRVGKRLPNFFRRVAQFSDENERPLFSVLGRTRCVQRAIGHLPLPAILLNGLPSSVSTGSAE